MTRIKIREYEPRACFFCGRNGCGEALERHHIFEGRTGTRELCDKYGLWVDLCGETCHRNGPKSAHKCRETAERLHKYGQIKWMLATGGSVDEFRLLFIRNYLTDAELDLVRALQAAGVKEFEADFGGYNTREGKPVKLDEAC